MAAKRVVDSTDDDDLSTPLGETVIIDVPGPVTIEDDSSLNDGYTLRCPDCGRTDFKNEGGLKRHRTVTHGTSSPADHPMAAGRKAKKSLEDDLATMLGAMAMAVSLFDQYDGMVVAQNGPPVARAWSNLALQNPKVDRILRSMMGGVSYGEVIMATAGLLLPILAHHKILPPSMAAIFAPVEPAHDASG